MPDPCLICDTYYGKEDEFWQQLKDHSSYDDFWQKRHSATSKRYQTCSYDGRGWFDAEDLYGPLNTYQAIEKTSKNYKYLLWDHGVMEIGQEMEPKQLLET
jgi:predicted acyl esterase